MGLTDITDLYVRIETDLLIVGDSIITDRYHTVGQNMEQYDDAYPQNEIGGIIPSFSLSGWLRHGIESALQGRGGEVCHPGEASANFRREEMYERDLDSGYHEKGACLDDTDDAGTGCVVVDMFGGFERMPGKFMRRPIQFSPNRSDRDITRGQAEGHYRRINRNITSRNEQDGRTPLRATEYDAVANLEGTWHLQFREVKPEFIGAIHAGLQYLHEHNTDYMHQLGGARNFGAGIVTTGLINPLYDDGELRNLFNRGRGKTFEDRKTTAMVDKDERWQSDLLPAAEDALDARL